MRRSQVCASRFALSKTRTHGTHNCRDPHHSWQARRPNVTRAMVLWEHSGHPADSPPCLLLAQSGQSRHCSHLPIFSNQKIGRRPRYFSLTLCAKQHGEGKIGTLRPSENRSHGRCRGGQSCRRQRGQAPGQLGVIREHRGGASRLDFRGEMAGWAGAAFAALDRQKMTRIGAF